MALAPGTRLGPYEITAQIGVGGMGEVYRATDTGLKRQVAIKVLPESVGDDVQRLARFQREAEVLAALNHPNIAQIHGLEKSDGAIALVMELVEGPTLAERIEQGAIVVDEALHIAKQISEALEAAHEQGIIHRDLKPANIKLRPDGAVKVLDFGLAKAMEPGATLRASATHALSQSPTITTPAMTHGGMILGTAAYMSPEQARGHAVDRRTDIWAFGCVLYEMLTGRTAFGGGDAAEILARVLEREPDWTRLAGSVPQSVRRLVRVCLEKNPKNRRQAAGDLRIDIDQILNGPAVDAPVAVRRRWDLVWFAVTVALVAVWAIPVFRSLSDTGRADAPPDMRLQILTPVTPAPFQFALSPDGRHLVFVASGDGRRRLWLRPLDQADAHPLEGTDEAQYPFWSPDSRSVGFFTSNRLYRSDIAGGAPQALANVPDGRGGTWSSEGTIVFAQGVSFLLFQVDASGGEVSAVTRLQTDQSGHRFPQFLPDGRQFLFYAAGNAETSGIYLGSLNGEQPKRLATADTAGAYLVPDSVIFVRQRALVVQRLDPRRRELMGEPTVLAEGVGTEAPNLGGFSVSSNGLVAYRAGGDQRSQLVWRDRTGGRLGAAAEADANSPFYLDMSPDGRRVAVQRTIDNNTDIWLLDVVRGGSSRFTSNAANEQLPTWSPDGTQVVFSSNRTRVNNLYLKSTSGAGGEELLLDTPLNKQPQDWASNGRSLLYYEIDPATGRDLWALDMTGDARTSRVVANSMFEERGGRFSPDGRWVAYETNESGRFEIVVQSFPEPRGRWPVSTSGGTQPRWSADGREIYFMAPDETLMAASIVSREGRSEGRDSTLDVGRPTALFSRHMASGVSATYVRAQYDVSGDGRFLVIEPVEESITVPITLIVHPRP